MGDSLRERRKVGSESRSEDSITSGRKDGTMNSEITKQQLFNSRFRQQKLPARSTVMRPFFVIAGCLVTGVILTILGVVMLVASQSVFQHEEDYTDCDKRNPACGSNEDGPLFRPCHCTLNFTVPEGGIRGPVFFYYGLSNYNQNLRRYFLSKSDSQFMGTLDGNMDKTKLVKEPSFFMTKNRTIILPAGALPNSFFNDTLELKRVPLKDPNGSQSQQEPIRSPVKLSNEGIAWPSDISGKFTNIENFDTLSKEFAKPPSWDKNKSVTEILGKDGFRNEDFVVWMRVAGLPKFRKLWRVVDRNDNGPESEFKEGGLPEGIYYVTITYDYNVRRIHGQKRFIVSTTSWMGGKNSFLGIAYIVTGIVCAIAGLCFLALHHKFGKSWTQLSNLDEANKNGLRMHGYI